MKDWETVQTSLSGIANKAKTQTGYRFRNLYGMLNEAYLQDCWRRIRKDAASGVDGVSAGEYERNLQGNVRDLVGRLKEKRYRARLVRRKYIPKGGGKWRPLGIPIIDDKLVQMGATRILQAIYEQDFLGCSYGYRSGIGARDAVRELTGELQFGAYNYVVEVDIKSFFDTIDHDWLIRMLEERIDDEAFLRLIRKWLKAGILEEDGKKVVHPGTGTPQGGIVSPVLANIYLHYTLDLWFDKVVRGWCRGEVCIIRYADDFVCAFRYQEDAERFLKELVERLKKFKLDVSEEKTRMMKFRQGNTESRFDFLGFEFYWGRDRKGRPHLKRRTSRNKLRTSLRNFKAWLKENRDLKWRELYRKLNSKLRGYFNYYGVIGNICSLQQFYVQIIAMLHKWLNRCGQRGKMSWIRLKAKLERYKLVRPSINERPFQWKPKTVCLY
jgi:RNA-directed DNA polymerase